jgi:hypothetical protein
MSKDEKIEKRYLRFAKKKMPKVEMPTNSKSQLKWFSSIEWPFLNKSKN